MTERAVTDRPVKRGVLVLGGEPLPPSTLAEAEACDEVFVVARAVADDGGWLFDEDRAYGRAYERVDVLRRHLRAHGVVVHALVVDGDAAQTRKDAEALCPGGALLS
jgi:hypothetical protein